MRSSPKLIGSTLVAAMATLLGLGEARADVANTNPSTWCHPASSSDAALLTYDTVNGTVTVAAGNQSANVICPIAKTTSGPSVTTNDQILSVTMAGVQNPNGTYKALPSTCVVNVFSTDINGSTPNRVAVATLGAGGTGWTVTGSWSSTKQNYWNGSGSTTWFFAQLECNMINGQAFTNFTVAEKGSTQAYRIYSSASCARTTTSDAYANRAVVTSSSGSATGGFIEAPGGGSTPMRYLCPIPGSTYQFSFLPAVDTASPMVNGFQLNSADSSYPARLSTSATTTGLPSFTYGPYSVPGSATLYFQQVGSGAPYLGDPGIVSYRTTGN